MTDGHAAACPPGLEDRIAPGRTRRSMVGLAESRVWWGLRGTTNPDNLIEPMRWRVPSAR